MQHLELHSVCLCSKHFRSLSVPQMCCGNRNVLRTLSKVPNPSLVSQRDWVSADGAAFHTQPACTSPSCYRFPWHLERWHDKGVAQARRHHLHSHSITHALYCTSHHFLVCTPKLSESIHLETRQNSEYYCAFRSRTKTGGKRMRDWCC